MVSGTVGLKLRRFLYRCGERLFPGSGFVGEVIVSVVAVFRDNRSAAVAVFVRMDVIYRSVRLDLGNESKRCPDVVGSSAGTIDFEKGNVAVDGVVQQINRQDVLRSCFLHSRRAPGAGLLPVI